MKIDYKKFKDYSENTQQEIIDFSRDVLSWIEMFDKNDNEITLFDFEKGDFDLQKIGGLWKNQNSILNNTITEISHDMIHGWGPDNNRRLTVDLVIKYKPDTVSVLKEFLKKVDKNKVNNYSNHSNTNEEIILKTIDVKITGNRIARKDSQNKKAFNPAEKELIYFLYFKFKNNADECFTLEILEKELDYPKEYLKNRITNIHKVIGKTISKDKPIKITFIKHELGRGYHLNPQLFI